MSKLQKDLCEPTLGSVQSELCLNGVLIASGSSILIQIIEGSVVNQDLRGKVSIQQQEQCKKNIRTSSLAFSTLKSSPFSSSFFTPFASCCLTGTSTSFSTSTAVERLSGSSYSAKPNRQALLSASIALVHRRRFPAHCRIRSMPSSLTPSVMPPTNIVFRISSFVGGISCIMFSRTACLWASKPSPAPIPCRPDLGSALLSLRPESPIGIEGFPGPVVPRRMTGALKLMLLGKLAGGWKFEPPRPGCWEPDCMPGAEATPGADIPGGGATERQLPFAMRRVDCATYPFLGVGPCPAAHLDLGSHQRVEDVHIAGYLCTVELVYLDCLIVAGEGRVVKSVPVLDLDRGSSNSYLDNYTC